jgi:ectoine hydroxylase-related dioxygenase (phytanoyl-CoA dioxygenase family)
MLSGCFHGASANRSVDGERLLYGTFFCKSRLRQEENQYLENDLDVVRHFDERLLRIMGFEISKPLLGVGGDGESWEVY